MTTVIFNVVLNVSALEASRDQAEASHEGDSQTELLLKDGLIWFNLV